MTAKSSKFKCTNIMESWSNKFCNSRNSDSTKFKQSLRAITVTIHVLCFLLLIIFFMRVRIKPFIHINENYLLIYNSILIRGRIRFVIVG